MTTPDVSAGMPAADSSPQSKPVSLVLLPIMAAVLAGFLIIGIALPVLPLHVEGGLGYGPFMVGLVAGAQFAASLISRIWAGSFADRKGAKRAVVIGLLSASLAGLLYLVSLAAPSSALSVAILLAGRAILGGAESFIITGAVSWGLALVDAGQAGKVIAWIGMAMFAALALGGPIGTVLYDAGGFLSISLATLALPLIVLALIWRVSSVATLPKTSKSALRAVAGAVWLPGLGAACSSIGYGAILAFSSLYYSRQNWHPIWLAFSAFGAALILARVFLAHLPDRHGGARTAFIFVLIQATGLALMWIAQDRLFATLGAALAGLGYSLVYPGLGVEAVRGVAPENRGLAMGLYTACLDLAMGFGSPALGWIAGHAGVAAVFAVSALVVLAADVIAFWLWRRAPTSAAVS
jgi:MFS family permease